MPNATPYQLISGPIEVYVAPVGESMPAIGTEPPGGNWTLIGTNGAKEYSDDGVTIVQPQTVEDFRGLGNTGPYKSFRTEEDLQVRFTLHDMTLEEYARALNFATVATDSDDKTVDLYRGQEVAYMAMLIRGEDKGPYGSSYNIQWEIPRVREDSSPELVFSKGAPVGYELSFMAMIDLNAASESEQFGIIRTQFQN